MNECSVVFLGNSLERHAKEIVVGFQDALCHRIALHMLHAPGLAQHIQHAVAHDDGNILSAVNGLEITHCDVVSEAHHLVADGVFEAQHHTHGDEHHGQTDGHAQCCYFHGRTAHAVAVALMVIDPPCYE